MSGGEFVILIEDDLSEDYCVDFMVICWEWDGR